MADVFESINLKGSEYQSIHHPRPAGRSPSTSNLFNATPTVESDDEINPAELLLSESSNGGGDAPDHEFFLRASRVLSPPSVSQFQSESSESPLQFASNRNDILLKELEHNLNLHRKFLIDGEGNLNRIRSMIFQNFEQLSQGYYSVNELYSREVASVELLLSNFERWDKKRNKILDKFRAIKNPETKHGSKLSQLLDKANDIDDEIDQLEKRLNSLRSQKSIISAEIEVTSSVLESKTSRYVEMLRNLENQGKQAMLSFLNTSGVPVLEIDNIVKTVPIDITFLNEYNIRKSTLELKKEQHSPEVETPTKVEPIHGSTMGMQPFVIPEVPEAASSSNEKKDVNDKELWNHGYGPSAYEKGFEKGSQVSSTVKRHIESFLNDILQTAGNDHRAHKNQVSKVDDENNTVKYKLDIEPIVELLDHKLAALNDLNKQSSKDAILYHEYSAVWSDIIQRLEYQEEKLAGYMSESTPAPNGDPTIVSLLKETLTYIQLKSQSIQHTLEASPQYNALLGVIQSELNAIISALTMVSNDFEENSIVSDFKKLGIIVGKNSPTRTKQSFRKPEVSMISKPTTGTHNLHSISSGSSSVVSDMEDLRREFHAASSSYNKNK